MDKDIKLRCMRCRLEQPLHQFKVFDGSPFKVYDFCKTCVEKHGEQELYQRYKGYTTKEIQRSLDAVRKARPREVTARARSQRREHQELARRELMRRRLVYYTSETIPKYKAGWVHNDICARLERFMADVEAEKSPRLLLTMPPRHGKSQIASETFIQWVLGHHPDWEFIHAATTITLIEKFSRNTRDMINSAEYQAIFPKTQLRQDSQSVQAWLTTEKGGYLAAGVGTGIVGRGAKILVVDDPVKDDEAADSEDAREKVLAWYFSVARSRLAPGGGVLLIMTRWHDMDLAGRLLQIQKELEDEEVKDSEVEHWDLVNYPAIAEADEYLMPDRTIGLDPPEDQREGARLLRKKGEALHPERYSLEALMRIKHPLMRKKPRHWHALYQQKPVPDEGEFFQKSMFRYEPILPDYEGFIVVSAWDLAIGLDKRNDWTVGVVGAIDYDDNLHIIDLIRGKMMTQQIADAIFSVYNKYRPTAIGIERGTLQLSVQPVLRKLCLERRQYPNFVDTLKPIHDKETRAGPLRGRMQHGRIYFPQNQPWVEQVHAEFLRFPNGEHDDIVDAMAYLTRMCVDIAPPRRPVPKKMKSWRDKVHAFNPRAKSFMSA